MSRCSFSTQKQLLLLVRCQVLCHHHLQMLQDKLVTPAEDSEVAEAAVQLEAGAGGVVLLALLVLLLLLLLQAYQGKITQQQILLVLVVS